MPGGAHRTWCAVLVVLLLLLPRAGIAVDVQLVAITPGRNVTVVVPGQPPMTIEVGESANGIALIRTDHHSAVLSINGVTKTLPLVANPSGGSMPASDSLTLLADNGGQFVTRGSVNGVPVNLIVDTGATLTSFSRTVADRIGLVYERGAPSVVMTAAGPVLGWRISLATVEVGDLVAHNVDAVVMDTRGLDVGLLGMSFLGRFEMHHKGSTLVLRRNR